MTSPTPLEPGNDPTRGDGPGAAAALCPGARAITAELPDGAALDTMTTTQLAEVLQRLDLALDAQQVHVAEQAGAAAVTDPAAHPGSAGVALIRLAGAAVVDAYTAAQARERAH